MAKAKKKKSGIELVTTEWIKEKMLLHKLDNEGLGKICFVSPMQIYQWLSGFRSPSNPSKAVIYYALTYYTYIKRKEGN